MRFYFGFSKRLNPKTLLFILGLVFIGLLAFFGLSDTAFAWSSFDRTKFNIVSYQYLDCTQSNGDISDCSASGVLSSTPSFVTNNNTGAWFVFPGNSTTNPYTIPQYYNLLGRSNANEQYKYITRFTSLGFDNSHFCSSSNKSVSFKFPIVFSGAFSNNVLTSFNANLDGFQPFKFYLVSLDSSNNVYRTLCDYTFTRQDNSSPSIQITCSNAMYDDSATLGAYSLELVNPFATTDFFFQGSSGDITTSHYGGIWYLTSSAGVLQYECSDDDPVYEQNPTEDPEPETTPANDIFCTLFGNCSGGGSDGGYIPSLNSITGVITAPLRLLNHIYDSIGDECSSISLPLDLSYNGESFVKSLALPCGEIMWSHFPSSVVVIYHTLIFGVFAYRVLIDMVRFINKVLNPEDSKEYFLEL